MKQNYSSIFSFLKKSMVIFAVAFSAVANAQVANYGFSQVIGTYTPITGGTVLASGPNFYDDNTFGPIPIGFSFIYDGTTYTDVTVAANGWVKFGTTLPGCCWYNGTSIENEPEAVHPFSEDLLGNSATCELSYLTAGTPGSQTFTIQWKDWGFYSTGASEMNFQLILYEGTNVIEFAYSPNTITAAQTPQAGLTGITTTDFNSRTTSTDWTATTPSAVNTAQLVCSPTIFPPSGLEYFWVLAPVDVSALTLVAPAPNSCYSSTETVTIRIQNLGSQILDFSTDPVTVSCSVAGPNPQTFSPVVISSGTLAPSGTQDVVITTTYDMSAIGTYTFNASATTPNDGNPGDDNMSAVNIVYGLAASSAAPSDTICVGASATLTLTGFGGPIQWQSFDGVSWNNETGPGNNSSPYTVSPTANTDYRAMFCGTVVSNTLSVIVINPVPPVTTGDTRCGYGTVNLSAAGVGNMVWYTQPTGGSPIFTGNNYSPTVAVTDTFYVESQIGSANPGPLTTTFAAGNGQNGNMFNITALQTVTITHFDGHMATGTDDWTIYYRPGTFIGFETDSSTWTNLGTAVGVVAQGAGVPTPIPLMFSVTIPAGQTYGFYVTTHASTISYTNGTTLDAVFVQDANIQVRQGKGNAYPFGGNFSPRIWNGNVYYTSGCASATRSSVIAMVTTPDSVVVTASQTSICGLPASATVTLSATSANPGYNYTWTGADLNQNSGPSVTATPNATTTYIVTGDDGVCADTAAITIILTAPPPAAATATPSSICLGQPAQLSTPPGQVTYAVNSIPYAPVSFTGSEGPVGDDVLMLGLPIGFTFNFFGTDYTQFAICTNGNIQFGPNFSNTFFPATIPTVGGLDNYIGIPMCDMFVDTTLGQHIKWATLGTAPNRMLVVSWDSARAFSGGGFYKSQAILYEGTNCIEVHANFVTNTTANKVLGIENQTGTVGAVAPGRNNVNFNFNTPEAWSFCPIIPYTFSWTPSTWLSSSTVFNPALTPLSTGNFTYTVTTTDVTSGCTSTSSVSVSVVPVPTAPTSSNLSRCGTGTVTLTATAAGPGTLQWWDAAVGGNQIGTGSPLTSPVISFTDTFYVEEFDGNCPGPRTAVIVTVIPADTIIATTTSNPMCSGNPVTITLSSLDPNYSYSWSPAIGLSSTTGSSVTANPPFTTLYTINAIDGGGCQTSTSISQVVNPSPVIVASSATPSTVCAGSNTQLNVNYVLPPTNYYVNPITYAPLTPTGSPTILCSAGVAVTPLFGFGTLDDGTWEGLPLPFTFDFYGLPYNTFSVSTNGYIAMGDLNGANGCCVGQLLPNTNTPNNVIAIAWEDFYLFGAAGGTIDYFTNGVAPFRQFVVRFTNVGHFFNLNNPLTGEIILNETANTIEIHITSFSTDGDFAGETEGIEDASGTLAATVPGRNSTDPWPGQPIVNDAWIFTPIVPYDFLWTPSATLSTDTIVNPVANPTTTTTYTISVTDPTFNCTSTSTVTVTVNPLPVVTFTPLNGICIDASPLPLAGGTPTGGTYSGPGVSNNIFYPAVAGVGTYTILYTYTNNLGCSGTDSTTITVNDLPVVTLQTFTAACDNGSPINLTTGAPVGGTYSGTGVSGGMFDPTAAGAGIHGITYTYTDANGCTNSALRNIVVHSAPSANAGPDVNGNVTLNGSASGGTPPYTYMWTPCLDMLYCNTDTPFVNPQVNTYYIMYVIDANGCYATDSVLVNSTVGISAVPVENSGLLVYPNPASGMFNILFLTPNNEAEVSIVNAIGQEIYASGTFTAPAFPYQINLSSQPDGIYIMQVKYRDKIITSRLVLNK